MDIDTFICVSVPLRRTGGDLKLSGIDVPTCICDAGIKGAINGVPFHKVAIAWW
jgi:hypothetical protein